MMKPEHLGGGEMRCHDDMGSLKYMKEHYGVKSMLDIGCGRGCQVAGAIKLGMEAMGVDGDIWDAAKFWEDTPIIAHDYTQGPLILDTRFDLVWTVEFLEHVDEKYIPNYMPSIQLGKYVICTHALPGKPGHHHVNCQPQSYWVDVFRDYGFTFDEELTQTIRKESTMKKYFMRDNGLVFINES